MRIREIKILVTADNEGLRIDKLLSNEIEYLSRRKIKRIIEAGGCYVNGRRCHIQSYHVKEGEKISVYFKDGGEFRSFMLKRENIVYEDDFILILNKPSGVPVNLSITGSEGSVQKGVERYLGFKASIVHRLDMGTSGLLIFCKDKDVEGEFYQMFRERKIKKEYLAVTFPEVEEGRFRIKTKIARDVKFKNKYKVAYNRGKESITYVKGIKRMNGYSLVKLIPKTGRSHQLRVHMSFNKTPILGDTLYGGLEANRIFLHAFRLSFLHPILKKEMDVRCVPGDEWKFFRDEIRSLLK